MKSTAAVAASAAVAVVFVPVRKWQKQHTFERVQKKVKVVQIFEIFWSYRRVGSGVFFFWREVAWEIRTRSIVKYVDLVSASS